MKSAYLFFTKKLISLDLSAIKANNLLNWIYLKNSENLLKNIYIA